MWRTGDSNSRLSEKLFKSANSLALFQIKLNIKKKHPDPNLKKSPNTPASFDTHLLMIARFIWVYNKLTNQPTNSLRLFCFLAGVKWTQPYLSFLVRSSPDEMAFQRMFMYQDAFSLDDYFLTSSVRLLLLDRRHFRCSEPFHILPTLVYVTKGNFVIIIVLYIGYRYTVCRLAVVSLTTTATILVWYLKDNLTGKEMGFLRFW